MYSRPRYATSHFTCHPSNLGKLVIDIFFLFTTGLVSFNQTHHHLAVNRPQFQGSPSQKLGCTGTGFQAAAFLIQMPPKLTSATVLRGSRESCTPFIMMPFVLYMNPPTLAGSAAPLIETRIASSACASSSLLHSQAGAFKLP